ATAFYCDIVRLSNPVGEKYVGYWPPGQIDFSYPYLGARAYLAGVNPYRNDREEFTHPIFQPEMIDGVPFKQSYPPGHFLLDLPMVLAEGADWQAAARLWFRFSLVVLALIAVISAWLVAHATETAIPAVWVVLLYIALVMNTG